MECTLMLMPFTTEAVSLHAKPAKHKLHLSAQSSLTIETSHFDALTHNLYYCAYSGLQNTFGSCKDRRLNQSRSTAVIPGWARREERLSRSELYQPFRIDSDAVLRMNLIQWIRFGSCEVRRLNRALNTSVLLKGVRISVIFLVLRLSIMPADILNLK